MERTLVLVKPDGVRRGLTGEVLRRIEAKGYTLVRLELREATPELLAERHYEEGLRDHRVSTDGLVEATTDDVTERIRTAARNDPPEETRLIEILRLVARRGGLRLGERDRAERVTPVSVLPGILVLASDAWLDRLRAWLEAGEA